MMYVESEGLIWVCLLSMRSSFRIIPGNYSVYSTQIWKLFGYPRWEQSKAWTQNINIPHKHALHIQISSYPFFLVVGAPVQVPIIHCPPPEQEQNKKKKKKKNNNNNNNKSFYCTNSFPFSPWVWNHEAATADPQKDLNFNTKRLAQKETSLPSIPFSGANY